MRRRTRSPARRLRIAVDRLPRRTKEAMLRGIESNRIIVGAYVDPRSGGICPMLAAHRNGGRTSVASFARAWDEYTGARRPRVATRREVRTLRSLLEASLAADDSLESTSIAELAAQIRAEREQLAACRTPSRATPSTGGGREVRAEDEVEAAPEAIPDPEIGSTRPPEPRGVPIRVRRLRRGKDLLAALEEQLSRS